MTPDPLTVTPDTQVMDAMKLLKGAGFRRLPVLDGDVLVGLTTRRDLHEATPSRATTLSVWELNYLLSRLTVGEMMVRELITAQADEYLEDVALRMQQHGLGGLPVLGEAGQLSGIITAGDVMRALTGILGTTAGGVRLTLDMPDVPGSLARATQAALPSNIVSVATAGASDGHRQFVVRLNGEGTRGVRQRLREVGIDVLD
jgi:acetoin utilization protein AcuB